MLFRGIWMLRRRYCTGPLLLLGIAVGLFYHTVTMDRDRTEFKSSQRDQMNRSAVFDYKLLLKNPERLLSLLEASQTDFVYHSQRSCAGKAIILTGQHAPTDTEVQLYKRVLQQQGYRVDQARYAETSASLRQDRRGVTLPILPSACAFSTSPQEGTPNAAEDEWRRPITDSRSDVQRMNATINVYVLVTSATPLTAFVHRTALVKPHLDKTSYATEVFFRERLGPVLSHKAIEHMNHVISDILKAALLTTKDSSPSPRCQLCFQLMTFSLHYNSSFHPVVVKLQTDLHFDGMKDPHFDGQIAKEYMLEDVLKLLFPACSSEAVEPSLPFRTKEENQKLYPTCPLPDDPQHDLIQTESLSAQDYGWRPALVALLQELSLYYTRKHQTERCVDPHLRQLYTDPPMVLMPAFSAWEKEYRAEVPFDVITIRIRPEAVSPHCHIHLDEHHGPSRINILVMDESEAEPIVMTIYTLYIYRESRPSLPMFDEYVMCSFMQDCGLVVRPDQPCGLEPIPGTRSSEEAQASPRPCLSGDEPGRWVVPCLSCSDNRTCDWREVAWQPDSCFHPLLDQPQLQTCMMGRKVLFIGDSTNRGMMYYLMERVNTTLEDWDKAHDTIVYHNLNQGRTIVSYSYYPQFWLPKAQRPTFQRALQQLLEREGLEKIMVVVKSLGMGFHLPVDGIRSLPLNGVQELYNVNKNILESAKYLGYEVYKLPFPTAASQRKLKIFRVGGESRNPASEQTGPQEHEEPSSQPDVSYHVKGPVNAVYSEILLSRICVNHAINGNIHQQ
ncbi:hypothetical protein cypCar_00018603 [Cyprinus carpio]|nr:hypothetical protein cypCar_00018603 [Cyprinus carpio]